MFIYSIREDKRDKRKLKIRGNGFLCPETYQLRGLSLPSDSIIIWNVRVEQRRFVKSGVYARVEGESRVHVHHGFSRGIVAKLRGEDSVWPARLSVERITSRVDDERNRAEMEIYMYYELMGQT